MLTRKSRIGLGIGIAVAFVGLAASGAAASTLYINVPRFTQEQSNWCWVATAKSVIKYQSGLTPSQCEVYKLAKGTTTCPNTVGNLGNVVDALAALGFTRPGHAATGILAFSDVQRQMNIDRPMFVRWGWNSTGGATGHMVVLRGYNTAGAVSYLNPADATDYLSSSYDWMVAGDGHTWTHSLWDVDA